MADYYSILGLTKNATDVEIKTAFRKLAKVYHPDKNPHDPNAKTVFEHILKAYNTLINPHSRKRYDELGITTQIKRNTQTANPKQKGQKEWNTTEEELKRREYYKQHYHQVKNKTANIQVDTKPYSDYKYILFATPIAVGLLMFIISIFNSEPDAKAIKQKPKDIPVETKDSVVGLHNGDKPYTGYFGGIHTFDSDYSMQINNSSNFDAVIAVFDKKTKSYLQHAYLQASYTIEFSKLPKTGVYWKCILGKNWNADKLNLEDITGGFDSIVQYQNWEKLPMLFTKDNENELTLLYVIDPDSKNKQYISNATTFFEK